MDKLGFDTKIYGNFQGLEQMRHISSQNPDLIKKEVTEQFEAILMQNVLKSMRDANKAFSSELFSSDQMDFFQDMFDKQLSLAMSNQGVGFAQMVSKNLDQTYHMPASKQEPNTKTVAPPHIEHVKSAPQPHAILPNKTEKSFFDSAEEFVTTLWSSAKLAARTIGADPKVLIAQAALETNWGKKIIKSNDEKSSHNLFNIKADASWQKKSISVNALEEKNGVMEKEKSHFRAYDSFMDSFNDYISFLKQNSRYEKALSNSIDPGKFISELQRAGYATDQHYADKIKSILSSNQFKKIIDKLT